MCSPPYLLGSLPYCLGGSLSFSPLLSLSLPVDVAEYVFLSPCLVGLVSLSFVVLVLLLAVAFWLFLPFAFLYLFSLF